MVFDRLPVLCGVEGRKVVLEHSGCFRYGFQVARGILRQTGPQSLEIEPEEGAALLIFGNPVRREEIFRSREGATDGVGELAGPVGKTFLPPPMEPEAEPTTSVFPWGSLPR